MDNSRCRLATAVRRHVVGPLVNDDTVEQLLHALEAAIEHFRDSSAPMIAVGQVLEEAADRLPSAVLLFNTFSLGTELLNDSYKDLAVGHALVEREAIQRGLLEDGIH